MTTITRPRPTFAAIAALVSLALVALAGPAAAAANDASASAAKYRPDARIRLDCSYIPDWQPCSSAWTGNNVYNRTAKGQKVTHIDYLTYAVERDPRVVMFDISIQNDGSVADRFRVSASGVTKGYRVKFLRKSTNITAAVEAGTYRTPLLAPGATFLIKAKVVMPCDSWAYCGQDRATRLVTVRSVGDSTARDAVKLVRKIWACTC